MKSFRVSTRVAAAAALPFLILTAFIAFEISSLLKQEAEAKRTLVYAEQMGAIYGLVHTLQVERGISAGFIGSKGASMSEALVKARENVDARLGNLAIASDALGAKGGERMREIFAASAEKLAKVPEIRNHVDRFDMATGEVIAFYSDLIATMSRIPNEVVVNVEERHVAVMLLGYVSIMEAKELAGQERGIGAGAIGAGAFTPASFAAFAGKSASQSALIGRFMALMPESVATAAEPVLATGISDELKTKRASLMAQNFDGLVASEWFADMTVWLGRLNEAGGITATVIVEEARAMVADSHQRLLLLGAILAGLIVVLAGSVFAIVRSIIKPLAAMQSYLKKMAEGEFDIQIPMASQRNEIGEMARAVGDLREALREKAAGEALERQRRAEQEAREERQRAQRACHRQSRPPD